MAARARRLQASVREAQAQFNEGSWRPSMMGLRAVFGNLWPSPQAEVGGPGLLTLLPTRMLLLKPDRTKPHVPAC